MGMGTAAVGAWREEHAALLDAQAALGSAAARLAAVGRALRQVVQMVVLGIGAWLVIGADASPGIMIAATLLLGRALQPVEQLLAGWRQFVDARAAWKRLREPEAGASGEARLRLPEPTGRLELERVACAPDRTRAALIKGVSLRLEPGESLGLLGASGSGKTTLVRLMLGLQAAHGGTVRLDGADVARWDRDDLGPHVGYLPQDVALLPGTIARNIARLGPVDDARVVEAAREAQVHDMILHLPQGYDTVIGDGGAGLSGGQRQRIALARALHGRPRLVVLDEPHAHLDAEGEAALQAALRSLKERGATVVVVGHRPSLMSSLDKLAVLRDGQLELFGPSAAVLARLQGTRSTVQPLVARPQGRQEAVA
jgi:PrtD family type I secretion system ABC transporter